MNLGRREAAAWAAVVAATAVAAWLDGRHRSTLSRLRAANLEANMAVVDEDEPDELDEPHAGPPRDFFAPPP